MGRPKNGRRRVPKRAKKPNQSYADNYDPEFDEDFDESPRGGPGGNFPGGLSFDFKIAEGCEEALSMWSDLTKEEKVEVLDISEVEIAYDLERMFALGQTAFDKILGSQELITTLRSAFIFGVSQGGVIPLPLEFITISLVRIMERHLLVMYARKAGQLKMLFTFMLLTWVVAPIHWIFSLIIMIGFVYLGCTTRESLKSFREIMMLPFECQNPDHYTARLDSFLCGLVCCSLGSWAPWYTAVVLVSLAPLIMIEIERAINALTDQRALRYIRKALAIVGECFAIYLAWYSTTLTILLVVFYFPYISRNLVGFSLVALEYVVRYPGMLYDSIFGQGSSILMQLLRFSGGVVGIWYLFGSFDLKDLVFGLPLTAFVLPPFVRRFLAPLCRYSGALLVAVPIDIFRAVKFVMYGTLFVVAILMTLWKYAKNKLGYRSNASASHED